MEMVLRLTPEELHNLIDQRVEERLSKKLDVIKGEIQKVDRKILTKKEAAEFMNKSNRTLENYMFKGINGDRLPYERKGKSPLFNLEELIEYKSKHNI